jgi:hypothetical protein
MVAWVLTFFYNLFVVSENSTPEEYFYWDKEILRAGVETIASLRGTKQPL